MPYAELLAKRIYFEVHGVGDPLVMIHHGFGRTKTWDKIYPAMVEAGYRVVMYDRRGYGQSERDADFKEFSFSEKLCSESVKELSHLVEYLEIRSFHIVAQCEGGVIGLEYASRYPERVKTIVVSSTLCCSTDSILRFMELKNLKPFHEIESDLREKLLKWHGKTYAETFYNDQFRVGGGAYGTGVFDLRSTLPYVKCAVLVLYPDRSHLFGVEQGVTMYRHLPKGELAVIPNCGHNTYEQRPQEYVHYILGFLKRYGF